MVAGVEENFRQGGYLMLLKDASNRRYEDDHSWWRRFG